MKKITTTFAILLALSFSISTLYVPIVSAVEDSWATMEPMPTARRELGIAVVDGKIYAIGGYNGSLLGTNEMYDPTTDTWTTKTPMPIASRAFGIAVVENLIYVIWGGYNQVYDPLTDTWENRTPMPTPRHRLCANVVNGKIYLIAGAQDYTGYPFYGLSDKTEVYDPETDTWTTKAEIPMRVADYAFAVVDNKIYIMGGAHGVFGGGWGNFNQVYDPENDTWASAEPVPVGFDGAAADATTGILAPKRVYVFGGFIDSSYNSCNLTQVYDPETNVWSRGTPMPTPRSDFAVAAVNDVLYIIGGRCSDTYQYTPIGYIPEFPSWIILPLFFVATLVVAVVKRKVFRPT